MKSHQSRSLPENSWGRHPGTALPYRSCLTTSGHRGDACVACCRFGGYHQWHAGHQARSPAARVETSRSPREVPEAAGELLFLFCSRRAISMSKTVSIVQSNYIPWRGYFDLINSVDEFILFDDVQYTRR